MGGTLLITIVVVLVIVPLAIFFAVRRGRAGWREDQRERSREEFGSEYERAARQRGSEEEAEKELRRRRGSVERDVEPLADGRREYFGEQWTEAERVFVDNPERSIEMADRTISDILRERRFVTDPSQSEEETERNLAATNPDIADDYREGRRIRAAASGPPWSRGPAAPAGTRGSIPRRTCARPSAGTAPSTNASWDGSGPSPRLPARCRPHRPSAQTVRTS